MDSTWTLPLRQVPDKSKDDLSIVWNRVRLAYEQKLFGQVTSVAYNHKGTQVSCTSSNQFALLRVPQTEGVIVNEQSDRALFSVRFRDDDKLFIQCSEKRISVKSPDTSFERQFLGHTRDVHCASFVGTHNFASGSDDTTIKLWDLLRDTELMTAGAHTDYVRSLEPYTAGTFFSGSYDHSVRLWDPRASFATPIQHSGPSISQAVEALCFISDLNVLACATGDQLLLYDMRKGITIPLHQSSCHTKTITSVSYSSEYKTIVTGSLDSRAKMFTLDGVNLHCLCTKRLENPVSAIAMHPLSQEFCVGMTNGDMKVFKVTPGIQDANQRNPEEEYFVKEKRSNEVLAAKMRVVQHQLKTFNYGKALKSALFSRKSDVIMSTIEELIRRGVLHVALSNQNDRSIAQVIRFAIAHIDIPQFSSTLFSVLEDIFEIYGTSVGNSVFLHRELIIARKRLGQAMETLTRMEKLQGIMEFIVSGSE